MNDHRRWECPKCGLSTDQPAAVVDVWHVCPRARNSVVIFTRRDRAAALDSV